MKPVRLPLRKMWELYGLLKNGIKKEEYIVDEVLEILEGVSQEDFLQSLWLMYPKIDFSKYNPVEMATLFIAGLKRNNFFYFAEVVQGLTNGNPR